jgi:hypothetical protein
MERIRTRIQGLRDLQDVVVFRIEKFVCDFSEGKRLNWDLCDVWDLCDSVSRKGRREAKKTSGPAFI